MGNSDSSPLCPYCATEFDLTPNQIKQEHCFCARCHGAITKTTHRRSRMSFLFPSRNNIIKDEHRIITLRDVFICPFAEDLQRLESEEKQTISSNYFVDHYLKPYFNDNRVVLSITSGTRIIIDNIEFKVISCYPPNGAVTESTLFHLNGDNNELLSVNSHVMEHLHVLPTLSSLRAQNMPGIDAKELLESHLKPYLYGNDECFYFGKYSHKMQKRHLIKNQMFTYKGIEWKVVDCHPANGFIDAQTVIHCDGAAIHDLTKIYIRPKYDSLPEPHKQYSTEQIKTQYIYTMTHGRFMYFESNNAAQWNFEGVDYIAYGMEPDSGIVTCFTEIYCKPIKSGEVIYIQQQIDEQFAVRLQQEEYKNILARNTQQSEGVSFIDPLWINTPLPPFVSLSTSLFGLSQQRMRKQSVGLSQQLLNTLPIYEYSIKVKNDDEGIATKGNDEDVMSCSICLDPYKDGDEIKFLPCLHKYHAKCVDHWLQDSVKCPICTTSVFH